MRKSVEGMQQQNKCRQQGEKEKAKKGSIDSEPKNKNQNSQEQQSAAVMAAGLAFLVKTGRNLRLRLSWGAYKRAVCKSSTSALTLSYKLYSGEKELMIEQKRGRMEEMMSNELNKNNN